MKNPSSPKQSLTKTESVDLRSTKDFNPQIGKLTFTLNANQKEWEEDLVYFKTIYFQFVKLAKRSRNLHASKQKDLIKFLSRVDDLINNEAMSIIENMDSLKLEFEISEKPDIQLIFQEYADLENDMEGIRKEFRNFTVFFLQELNRISPLKIY
ncbi:MAG: hypothetical protein HKN16_01325 [Saprospiraceae bacterium]|nr:hypothetical protein [Saprospiraceae bacterium]